MIDTPPKPKRRRWRWLAVGLLLTGPGITGWWNWPSENARCDKRFVGKWAIKNSKLPGGETLHLTSDGWQINYRYGTEIGRQNRWWYENGALVLTSETRPPAPRWNVEYAWRRISELLKPNREPITYETIKLTIVGVSADRLSFQRLDRGSDEITALRHPE